MIGYKIKKYRELRNFSQEHLAEKLGITQAAYSKIESDQSKVTTERVKKIAEVLDVPEADLMSEQLTFNINNSEFTKGGAAYINNFYEVQKDLYEGIITEMKQELNAMRKDREKMMSLIQKISLQK